MEVKKLIESFRTVLEFYDNQISSKIRRGKNHLVIDHKELQKLDFELAQYVLDEPEKSLKAAELVIQEKFDIKHSFYIRFKSLPKTEFLRIRDKRAKHIGKLITVEGFIQSKSDVTAHIISAKFECPSCANIINILQIGETFKEPRRCGCGRKGKFKLISKELIDGFSMVLEESPEIIKYGAETKKIYILAKADLSDIQIEEMVYQGVKVRINGILKTTHTIIKGQKKPSLDYYLEANYISFLETSFADIRISADDEKKITKLSKKKDILKDLTKSIFNAIYGHQRVKESIILQSFGGIWKDDLTKPIRGAIHILLIGDPGSGKSSLLKIASSFLPKFRYTTGSGATGRGLTAAVVRNELLGGYTVSAGVLPLAHNGVALLDELDKANPEDLKDLHEPLEQGTCSVTRANIQKTLLAKTSILAAANPKFGRFDPNDDIYKQTNFEPTLINRFDLIFPFKDIKDDEKDKKTALKILVDEEEKKEKIDLEFIKKYIAYSKRIDPQIPKKLAKMIAERYVEIRKKGGPNTFPISARQVGCIKRLTEAHARMRLRDVAIIEDVNYAITFLEENLYEIALDRETGQLDIDRIETGTSATKRNILEEIEHTLIELEKTYQKNPIPMDEVIDILNEKFSVEKVEEMIQKMVHEGIVFEPKRGFLMRIK